MENEIWKDIPGYEGLYKISDLGKIKSLKRLVLDKPGKYKTIQERILRPGKTQGGYRFVILANNGVFKFHTIHVLIAICFHGHIPNKHISVVDHKDNDKENNTATNIQITTNRINCSKDRDLNKKTSKYTGVSWFKLHKKWRADIYINNKCTYLGLFENEYDAHIACIQAVANIIKT